MQLTDHMVLKADKLRQLNRREALNEIWDNFDIRDEHFQTEGHCKNEINYELFEFKVFDGSQTICTNIQNFASNARQFLENFVCLDWAWEYLSPWTYPLHPNRTLKKWHKMVGEIESLCRHDMFNKNRPWGVSALKKVDDEVKAVFEEIKADLQAQTGITGEFKIHGYKTKHGGTTYFIRCSAAGKFVHAQVYTENKPPFKRFLRSVLFGESVNKFTALSSW